MKFILIVCLFWFSSFVYASSVIEILKLSPGVIQVLEFVPERFEDLPKGAKNGGLTPEGYKKCTDALPKENRTFFRIQYLSDSFKVEAVVGVPKDLSMEKKFPFVIYNRGGRKDFGKLQDCGILTMNSLFKNDSRYILLAPQLRGTSGSEGIDEYGGAEINDVHSLYRIAQSIAFVDSSSAFLVGWSRGGMTSYLAIKQGLRFNAAAVLAGIPDLLAVDKKRPDMQKVFDETIPKISSDRKKALQSRSAIYWPEKITTPLLLIHGVKDDKAPIESVLEFVKKLYLLNKPHKLVTFPNSGHHFEQNREELGPHVLNWFKEWSKN